MDSIQRQCSVENCTSIMLARGFCSKHYQRVWTYGSPDVVKKERHGLLKSPTYSSWINIKHRTLNPNNPKYLRYGARGITICNRWNKSFTEFYKDMGERPEVSYSIDRINNNGNYSCGKCEQCKENDWPMNCRWATKKVQVWNRNKLPRNTTGYTGVVLSPNRKRFIAQISFRDNGKRVSFQIGWFKTIEEAALAYDQAAIFFRGSEAKTNIL